jgi:hypothetical protein
VLPAALIGRLDQLSVAAAGCASRHLHMVAAGGVVSPAAAFADRRAGRGKESFCPRDTAI